MAYDDVIPPPSNMTVAHEHRAVLYLPDGRALVRQAGFVVRGVQTTGVNQPLSDNTGRKGGKGSKGGRKC